jgi:hypothetical protein
MIGQSSVPWNTSNCTSRSVAIRPPQKARTSSLVVVRSFREFQVECYLVQPSSYPPKLVLKLPKGFIGPYISKQHLHAKRNMLNKN